MNKEIQTRTQKKKKCHMSHLSFYFMCAIIAVQYQVHGLINTLDTL